MLVTDAQERKGMPICTGVLDYFADAIAEIAKVSKAGNDQHNPGQPLHWARGKSTDHEDCIVRHLMDRGTIDVDNQRHSAKLAWRALALLQQELEDEKVAKGVPLKEAVSRASKLPEEAQKNPDQYTALTEMAKEAKAFGLNDREFWF